MGWWPPVTSTIASRRIPSPTGPPIQSPSPSGPRWRSTSRILLRPGSSTASRGFSLTMPTIPHMECLTAFCRESEPRGQGVGRGRAAHWRDRLKLDAELLEHRTGGRETELAQQQREFVRVASDADPMAQAAQQPDPSYPRLAEVKLPWMQIDDRWPAGPLESSDCPARQPQRVESEISAASHRQTPCAELEHGQRNFPDALLAAVDAGRRLGNAVAVVVHREDRRVVPIASPVELAQCPQSPAGD